MPSRPIDGVAKLEWRGDPVEAAGPHPSLVEGFEAPRAVSGGAPDAQALEGGVPRVDPTIAVLVVAGEFGKPVAGGRAEQLAPIGGAAIAIGVQHEKSTPRAERRHRVRHPVAVEIEGESASPSADAGPSK